MSAFFRHASVPRRSNTDVVQTWYTPSATSNSVAYNSHCLQRSSFSFSFVRADHSNIRPFKIHNSTQSQRCLLSFTTHSKHPVSPSKHFRIKAFPHPPSPSPTQPFGRSCHCSPGCPRIPHPCCSACAHRPSPSTPAGVPIPQGQTVQGSPVAASTGSRCQQGSLGLVHNPVSPGNFRCCPLRFPRRRKLHPSGWLSVWAGSQWGIRFHQRNHLDGLQERGRCPVHSRVFGLRETVSPGVIRGEKPATASPTRVDGGTGNAYSCMGRRVEIRNREMDGMGDHITLITRPIQRAAIHPLEDTSCFHNSEPQTNEKQGSGLCPQDVCIKCPFWKHCTLLCWSAGPSVLTGGDGGGILGEGTRGHSPGGASRC